MMPEYKNKEMTPKKTKCLKCVHECWAPGVGEFKEGEVLSGDDLVAKMKGNPNFIEITEEA